MFSHVSRVASGLQHLRPWDNVVDRRRAAPAVAVGALVVVALQESLTGPRLDAVAVRDADHLRNWTTRGNGISAVAERMVRPGWRPEWIR